MNMKSLRADADDDEVLGVVRPLDDAIVAVAAAAEAPFVFDVCIVDVEVVPLVRYCYYCVGLHYWSVFFVVDGGLGNFRYRRQTDVVATWPLFFLPRYDCNRPAMQDKKNYIGLLRKKNRVNNNK